MNKFNLISNVELFNGLNLNPIPLETTQSMTTTKTLMALQKSINTLISNVNTLFGQGVTYTDEQAKIINDLLNNVNSLDAKFLKPQSVTLDKLSNESVSLIHDKIMDYVGSIMKFVTFEINDEGYFIANIPETWNGINFSTDEEGFLILTINY
jgi:hypothetical protein